MNRKHRFRFRSLTAAHVTALVASALLLAWSVHSTDYYAVPVVIGIVLLLQIVALIRHVEAHVSMLAEFFATVNYEDFTRKFVDDDVDSELKDAFNLVLAKFQDAQAAREVQASYLETVVRHVPVPFIAAKPDGALTLVNNPAKRLTGLPSLAHLDQLAELDPSLPSLMRATEPGRQQLAQVRLRGVPAELRISVSEIRLASGVERLYSIENLSGELTAREASAWRNLIRVLTHEIMNTLTPVTSLAQTAAGLLDNPDSTADVRGAVQTIARRSEGLMDFVSRYRELLKLPTPVPVALRISSVLDAIARLMSSELGAARLVINVVPSTLEVTADPGLLDQVVVNLVRNALDALDETSGPEIELLAELRFGRVLIIVKDNGPGVDAELQEQVFVPFFTTKREGSGIGLSLCRQIMSAHGGDIAFESGQDGTTVTLIF